MKGMKKWMLGLCLVGICASLVFLPGLLTGNEERADNPVAKREMLQKELAEMRAEMRANGWDFEIGHQSGHAIQHRAVVQFQTRIEAGHFLCLRTRRQCHGGCHFAGSVHRHLHSDQEPGQLRQLLGFFDHRRTGSGHQMEKWPDL